MAFQQLDTVIAFAGVMLLLSLMITTAVQAVVSLLGLRGRNLFWGVEQLFLQLAPKHSKAGRKHAKTIAGEVLAHPVLADGKKWFRLLGKGRWGPSEISPKELELVIQQMASRGFPDRLAAAVDGLLGTGKANQQVVVGATKLVGDTRKWFDTVMDAAADRFKLWTRWWTAIFAVLFAFGFQIDSRDILEQLSSAKVREQVISKINELQTVYSEVERHASAGEAMGTKQLEDLLTAGEKLDGIQQATGLTLLRPISLEWPPWRDGAKRGETVAALRARWPGLLMTALLLSLGAPFWSGVLSKLVGFRSLVTERQKPNPKPGGAGG